MTERKCESAENVTRSSIHRGYALEEEMSKLKEYYDTELVPKLTEMFQYRNVMQVPKLAKIVLNMGLGEAIHNIKILDAATEEL